MNDEAEEREKIIRAEIKRQEMNRSNENPDAYQIQRDVREILLGEAYNELQKFLLNLQDVKDLRTVEVAHLLLDAAKSWTRR